MPRTSYRIRPGRRYRLTARRPGEVRLVSFKDGQGKELLERDHELDLKRHAEGGKLTYRVLNRRQKVTIAVEVIPENEIHRKFYPDKVASTVIADFQHDPGEYHVALEATRTRDSQKNALWTGRDDTPARRLLLAGSYNLKITAVDEGGRETTDEKTFWVAPPVAQLIGPWFPQHFTEAEADGPVSNMEDADTAKYYLAELPDGSKYDCKTIEVTRAGEVLKELKGEASIMTYGGHGSVGRIWFYANNTDKKERPSECSLLVTHSECAVLGSGDRSYVKYSTSLPTRGKPLRDVLLVFLNTCYAGEGDPEDNMGLRMINLGADFVVAFKKSIYFPVAQDFTNEFFYRAAQGQTITKAAMGAIKYADKANSWIYTRFEPKAQSFIKIFKGPNVPEPHTLVPARYGAGAL